MYFCCHLIPTASWSACSRRQHTTQLQMASLRPQSMLLRSHKHVCSSCRQGVNAHPHLQRAAEDRLLELSLVGLLATQLAAELMSHVCQLLELAPLVAKRGITRQTRGSWLACSRHMPSIQLSVLDELHLDGYILAPPPPCQPTDSDSNRFISYFSPPVGGGAVALTGQCYSPSMLDDSISVVSRSVQ